MNYLNIFLCVSVVLTSSGERNKSNKDVKQPGKQNPPDTSDPLDPSRPPIVSNPPKPDHPSKSRTRPSYGDIDKLRESLILDLAKKEKKD
ncbi:hypothetical protein NUSPORA_01050 [Nucleospora cyclopteri]